MFVQPRETEDHRAVRQPGDVQGDGLRVVAWGSELRRKIAGNGARSRGAAVYQLDWDGLGMGVGWEVIV